MQKILSNCPTIQLKNCNFEPFCFLPNCVLLTRELTYVLTNLLKFPIFLQFSCQYPLINYLVPNQENLISGMTLKSIMWKCYMTSALDRQDNQPATLYCSFQLLANGRKAIFLQLETFCHESQTKVVKSLDFGGLLTNV